jgi:hypothetical protein
VESRNGKQEEVILRWTIRSAYRVKCLNWHFNVMGRSQSISNTSKLSLELIVAAPRWPRRGPVIVDPSCYAFKCDGRAIQCWVDP